MPVQRLTSQDLLQPKGRLNAAALWPKKKASQVNADLTAYLDEGQTLAAAVSLDTADETQTAKNLISSWWAYYRAYQDAYEIRLATPSSVALNNQGSAGTLLTQIEHLGELATEMLGKYQAALGSALSPDPVAVIARLGSESTLVAFEF